MGVKRLMSLFVDDWFEESADNDAVRSVLFESAAAERPACGHAAATYVSWIAFERSVPQHLCKLPVCCVGRFLFPAPLYGENCAEIGALVTTIFDTKTDKLGANHGLQRRDLSCIRRHRKA